MSIFSSDKPGSVGVVNFHAFLWKEFWSEILRVHQVLEEGFLSCCQTSVKAAGKVNLEHLRWNKEQIAIMASSPVLWGKYPGSALTAPLCIGAVMLHGMQRCKHVGVNVIWLQV